MESGSSARSNYQRINLPTELTTAYLPPSNTYRQSTRMSSMQAAADARKSKLAALKKRKTLHDSADPQSNTTQP